MPPAGPVQGVGQKGPGPPPLRVAIVNDYQVIVAGLMAMLAAAHYAVDVVELDVRRSPEHDVDVALFDSYGQPGLGLHRIRSLVANDRVGSVAVYTWSLTRSAREAAFGAGARGIIAKALPAEQLVIALRAVFNGEVVETGGFRGEGSGHWPGSKWGLTARESETLALVATGMPNRAIAEALFLSENTVRTHLKAVFRKLGVTNRSQAVGRALADESFANRPSEDGTRPNQRAPGEK
jgi:two-component system, NarL family, response regulator LiaR